LLLLPGRSVCGPPAALRSSSDPEVADFFDEELDVEALDREERAAT